MKILYDNKAINASLSATNPDDSFPIQNIVDRFLEKRFQSITTSTVITILFSMDTDISCISLGYHNLSAATYELKNSAGASLLTGSLVIAYDTDMTYFTETTCRSVELTLTSLTTLYIGGVGVGTTLDIDYINTNPRIDYSPRDTKTIYRGGQATTIRTKPIFNYRVTVGDISRSLLGKIYDMIDTVGQWQPVYFDIYELNHAEQRPIYGLLGGDNQFVRDSYSQDYSGTITCEETR
jgi:hypothetical protein